MPFRFDNYAADLTPATDWKPGDPWDQHYTQPGLDDRDQQIEDAISAIGLATQVYATIAARNASGPRPGQRAWVTATLTEYLWDGTGWVIMAEPLLTFGALSVASTVGTITTFSGTTLVYHRSDGYLEYDLAVGITTNGTGAGVLNFTVPVVSAETHIGNGREILINGKTVSVSHLTAGVGSILNYDNTYPGANGIALFVHGRYRMTSRYS